MGMTGQARAICYRLAVATGLRYAEIGSITPESFDWDALASPWRLRTRRTERDGDTNSADRLGGRLASLRGVAIGRWSGRFSLYPGR